HWPWYTLSVHVALPISGLRRQLTDICGKSDTSCLEDIPHLARDVGAGGNDLAVLFDGGFLKAIEIVEERLPFGLQALFLTQAGEFLGQRQSEERDKHMAADSGIGLMEDGTGIEARLGNPEQGLDLKQVTVADD